MHLGWSLYPTQPSYVSIFCQLLTRHQTLIWHSASPFPVPSCQEHSRLGSDLILSQKNKQMLLCIHQEWSMLPRPLGKATQCVVGHEQTSMQSTKPQCRATSRQTHMRPPEEQLPSSSITIDRVRARRLLNHKDREEAEIIIRPGRPIVLRRKRFFSSNSHVSKHMKERTSSHQERSAICRRM